MNRSTPLHHPAPIITIILCLCGHDWYISCCYGGMQKSKCDNFWSTCISWSHTYPCMCKSLSPCHVIWPETPSLMPHAQKLPSSSPTPEKLAPTLTTLYCFLGQLHGWTIGIVNWSSPAFNTTCTIILAWLIPTITLVRPYPCQRLEHVWPCQWSTFSGPPTL